MRFFLRVFSLLLAAAAVYTAAGLVSVVSVFRSSDVVGGLSGESLRVKIYGSGMENGTATVSAVVSLVDSNGNEMSVIERSWSGLYLSVDYACAEICGRIYMFPCRVYGHTSMAGRNSADGNIFRGSYGTTLEKYFDEDGQCMLLGAGSGLSERKALYRIARFACRKRFLPAFSLVSVRTVNLSDCMTGFYYSISSSPDGTLSVGML